MLLWEEINGKSLALPPIFLFLVSMLEYKYLGLREHQAPSTLDFKMSATLPENKQTNGDEVMVCVPRTPHVHY